MTKEACLDFIVDCLGAIEAGGYQDLEAAHEAGATYTDATDMDRRASDELVIVFGEEQFLVRVSKMRVAK